MCLIGIDQCPVCELEFESKTLYNNRAALTCPNGHEWEVTDTQNIREFYPALAP